MWEITISPWRHGIFLYSIFLTVGKQRRKNAIKTQLWKTFCWVKRSQSQKVTDVWFQLHDILKKTKTTVTESRSVIARGSGWGQGVLSEGTAQESIWVTKLHCILTAIVVHKSIHMFLGLYTKNQSILPYYHLKIKLLKGKKITTFLSHRQQNAGLLLWNVTAVFVNKLYTTLS